MLSKFVVSGGPPPAASGLDLDCKIFARAIPRSETLLIKWLSIFMRLSSSYFTGKLESYMRYRELRVDRCEGTLEDLSRNIEVRCAALPWPVYR